MNGVSNCLHWPPNADGSLSGSTAPCEGDHGALPLPVFCTLDHPCSTTSNEVHPVNHLDLPWFLFIVIVSYVVGMVVGYAITARFRS